MASPNKKNEYGIYNSKQKLDPGCFFENLSFKGLLSDIKHGGEDASGYPSEMLFELSTMNSTDRRDLSSLKSSFVANTGEFPWKTSAEKQKGVLGDFSLYDSGNITLPLESFSSNFGSNDFPDLPQKEGRSFSYPVNKPKRKVIKLKNYLDRMYSNPSEDRFTKSLMHLYNMIK